MKRFVIIILCTVMVGSVFFSRAQEQTPAPRQLQLDAFLESYNVYGFCVNAVMQKKYTPVKAVLKKADSQGKAAFSIKDKKSVIEGYLEGEALSSLQVTLKSDDIMYMLFVIAALRPDGFAAGMAQPRDLGDIARQYFDLVKPGFDRVSAVVINGYELKEVERSKSGVTRKMSLIWAGGN